MLGLFRMSKEDGKVQDLGLQSEVKATWSNLVIVCFDIIGKNKAGDVVQR